ncbi:hypothetical protein DB346_16305 [Verrucomicrobia bacterium LW23]|nr:hypothetical protein DB346_16305 [Verrucomicrobia bacterium LW23]
MEPRLKTYLKRMRWHAVLCGPVRHRRCLRFHPYSRGAALLLTLVSLVFMTVLLVCFMLTVTTDRKSSSVYVQSSSVRLTADSVLNLAMAQVKQATQGKDSSGNTLAWASQPGMIRTFDTGGGLYRAYKLYSWHSMSSELFSANDAAELAPANWADQPALFVDLNAPVRNAYPIMNPAAVGKVEGFSIAGAPGDNATAPVMPVYWLYKLQDGSWVTPEAGPNGSEAQVPGATAENPIVARAAFWTDDESAKLNINTASEGQFWDSPRAMTPREMHMGTAQPAKSEYQRYPGHPFTTCLSPVFSGYTDDLTAGTFLEPEIAAASPFLGNYTARVREKRYLEKIYEVSPRVAWGGSQGGTVPFAFNTPAVTLDKDRFYATVDELAFKTPAGTGKSRTILEGQESASPLSQKTLEELRFFLTANSRAPEVNLFNQPRVSVWPVDDTTRTNPVRQAGSDPARGVRDQRSPLDKLLAFCSTIGSGANAQAYYFTRSDPTSASADLATGSRNLQLLAYLRGFMTEPVPGFGGSFQTKYPSDCAQILTQIFDYVRITNLMDASGPSANLPSNSMKADFLYSFCTPPAEAGGGTPQYQRHILAYADGDAGGPPASLNATATYAASGQVVPIRGPGNTKGFGNFPTVSSMGMMFIARHVSPLDETGKPNYVWDTTAKVWVKLTAANKATYSVPVIGNGIPECPDIYYKAYVMEGAVDETLDTNGDYKGGAGDPRSPFDTTLPNGHVRMQSILLISPFLVSPGFPGANPDYRIVVEGLNSFGVDGGSMGFASSGTLIMSGNFLGPTGDKQTKRYSTFAATPGLMTTCLGKNLGNPPTPSRSFYPFFAQNDLIVRPSGFSFTGGDLKVQIQTNGKYGSPVDTVQTLEMNFPSATFPTPTLPKLFNPFDPDWRVNNAADREKVRKNSFAVRHFGDSPGTGRAAAYFGRFRQNDAQGWSSGIWSDRFIMPASMMNNSILATADGTADVVQAVEVAHGDVRLIAGKASVPKTDFAKHASYGDKRSAHSFRRGNLGSLYYGGQPGGFLSAGGYYRNLLYEQPGASVLGNAAYDPVVGSLCRPGNWPATWAQGGDWDSGWSRMPDGPFINKPDEGTGYGAATGNVPYFAELDNMSFFSVVGANRVSPNRIMPSPVMFGSLPTGVNAGRPWQTLLFCPNPRAGDSHFALASGPPDHLVLDLFHMPVVEPYAISEPFSTAGKVNMNYRIVPFRHITRSTALRGVLKAVKLTAVPGSEVARYKGQGSNGMAPVTTADYRYFIHADETLKAFDARFDGAAAGRPEVFRSASEICDMFLYPCDPAAVRNPLVPFSAGNAAIKLWWADKDLTGDNLREQPYGVLYPRLTTRSNTFTVHMRVQTLTKMRTDSDQNIWREGKDAVNGEYRGSATFERFIDPNNPALPDFATTGGSIDPYYQFRVLHTKEFKP